jgi:hypothetical protein
VHKNSGYRRAALKRTGGDKPISMKIIKVSFLYFVLLILVAKSNVTVIAAAAITETISFAIRTLEAKKAAGNKNRARPTP